MEPKVTDSVKVHQISWEAVRVPEEASVYGLRLLREQPSPLCSQGCFLHHYLRL